MACVIRARANHFRGQSGVRVPLAEVRRAGQAQGWGGLPGGQWSVGRAGSSEAVWPVDIYPGAREPRTYLEPKS